MIDSLTMHPFPPFSKRFSSILKLNVFAANTQMILKWCRELAVNLDGLLGSLPGRCSATLSKNFQDHQGPQP